MTNGAASISTTSEAGTFSATAGTIYYIRVLKYNSADTAGSFTITAKTLPYPMASGNYLQDFTDIADWTDNFTSTTGAVNYLSVAVNNTGSIPDGVKTTVSSATFTTSQSGGIQKGTGNLLFLSTGTTSNGNSLAVDLPLDFSGRVAGTISFDWACVFNSTGNRGGTLSVYTSTDGTTWTLLSGTSVSVVNNVASSGTVSAIQLPSSFNNNANARVRFYQYADAVGTTGSRPKISLDNLAITSTAVTPSITIGGTTSGTATAFTTTYGTESAQQSFTIAGSNLTADISVGAVTGLEYSINSGSTWGTTQTITRSGTSASATLLVRLAATAVVSGSYDSQAIPLSSTGATTRNITTASTGNSVSKANPTISVAPTASAITYGQTLASSTLTGGTASTPGMYAFTTPSTAPNAGTASQNVTFTPTDGANYNTASTSASVTVDKASQTITSLAATDSKTYGGIYMDFDLSATKGASTSALSYSSSNTSVATIHPTTGSVHIVGAGTTTLTVNQAADANYNAAPAVTQILTVSKASQADVSGSLALATITFGNTTTVTASGGTGTGAYEFRQNGGTGSVSFTGTGASRTITPTAVGTAVIEVRRVADTNYNDSSWFAAGTLTVNLAAPSGLSYANINGTVGTAISNVTPAVTGSGITYSIDPALPSGLLFNPTSGVISGTPSVAAASAIYTVTATNAGGSTSTALTIVVGYAVGPVAAADSLTKPADNEPYMIPVSQLLANDYRITNSSGTTATSGLTVTAVMSGSGNSVVYNVGDLLILFTPSSASTETITYTVSYGGMTATGTVTITTETQAPSFELQIVKVGTAAFAGGNTTVTHDFIGVAGQTYLVEYKGDLAEASWTSAGAQSTGSTGSFSVTFTKAGDHTTDWNGNMFFQARRQ
jgi:hypothetical protein